jgi:hypothetical protein
VLTKLCLFGIRYLRKCSTSSGEWEDVGDVIAREKTSQVLRDAIQVKKSFSGDGEKCVWKDATLPAKPRRKDPPHKIKKTPPVQQQSFQSSRQKMPAPHWSTNPSLPPSYSRGSSHRYSPDYLSLRHPYNSYGRVPLSGPGNPRENVPNFSITSLPYQYPVTPTSSSLALSTGRKRPRYCQESPLIQGYHQYPYPTPIRSVNAPSTPPTSTLFTTPTNTKTRGLTFSPPTSKQRMDDHLSSLRRVSALHTTEETYPVDEMAHVPPPAPMQKSKVPSENRSGHNQDFDSLLTDDVLSDSDSKNNSTHLFSSHQDDLIF